MVSEETLTVVLELLEDPANNHNCEIETSDLGAAVCEADTIGAVLLRCVRTGEADLQLCISLDTSNVVCEWRALEQYFWRYGETATLSCDAMRRLGV